MKTRTLALALAGSAVLVAGGLAGAPPNAKRTTDVAATPAAATTPARVYYFHGATRCNTCRTIEAYTRETLTSVFAKDLEARRLEWRPLNVDEPANRHFVQDYQLYTRSVVLVDPKNPKRFKVLDRVWVLVHDKPAFQKYVEQEIRAFRRS
jgi:hypothetical protein